MHLASSARSRTGKTIDRAQWLHSVGDIHVQKVNEGIGTVVPPRQGRRGLWSYVIISELRWPVRTCCIVTDLMESLEFGGNGDA